MDTTIKTVHEGQTLNERNIQLLMKKMNMLGEKMEQLEHKKIMTTKGQPHRIQRKNRTV